MKIDSDHEHWAVVGLFAEVFDDILIKVVLNSLDHRDHVLLVLLD